MDKQDQACLNKPFTDAGYMTLDNELDIPNFFRRFNGYAIKGNYEFYCQEFAYSAIYGNIKQTNIPKIMELLKLDKLPRIMFLIRVDDYHDIYKTFPEFRAYPLKVNILNQLQKCLKEQNIEGVVSSFLGRDNIGVFLCLDGNDIKTADSRNRVGKLAQCLIEYIQKQNKESISIGISNFCNDLSHFPKAYSECQEALSNNFRLGKGTYSFYGDKEPIYISMNKEDMDFFTSQIIFYLDALDSHGYQQTIKDMIDYLSSTNTSWVDIRLHMVKFIDHVSEYYLDFGVEKKSIDFLSIKAMKEVLNSNFITTLQKPIQCFCGEILKFLIAMHQTTNEKIRAFVDECLKIFYSDNDFNLAKAASLCHYSPYHFGRLFKKVFNVSFNQYLNNYRVEKSKELLSQSQMTIETIAFQVGFSSASYFCTVFKKNVGVTPRQYAGDNLE